MIFFKIDVHCTSVLFSDVCVQVYGNYIENVFYDFSVRKVNRLLEPHFFYFSHSTYMAPSTLLYKEIFK